MPEIAHVFTINGSAGVRNAFVGFLLKPWDERTRNQKQVLTELSPKFLAVPQAQVQAFSPPALPGSTGGAPMQFVIRTTGDYATLADVALKMQQAARESGLFLFTDVDLKFDTPQLEFKVDADKANRIGVNMADVGTALATMLGGNYVNLFSLYGRSYQVIPQAPREFRFDPDWLTRYQVRTSNGELVPLSAVATVSEKVQPNALTSFQQLNSATLSGVPFPGRTLGEALDFLTAKSKEIFPEGYTYDFQGDSRQYEQEGNALVYVFVFALIVIYLVLAAQYESFRDPLIILIALPTALFGALLPLNIGGVLGFASINIYSQIGLVTLIGLISKHGILMVDFANRLQETHGLSRRGAIEEAAAVRLEADSDDDRGDGGRHGAAHLRPRRRRGLALQHRRHHLLRHGDRHAVHAVRHPRGLHVPGPRPRGADGEGEGARASREGGGRGRLRRDLREDSALQRIGAERRQRRPGAFHVLAVMPAAEADCADYVAFERDRKAAAEHDKARGVGDAVQKRRVVLDEVEPGVRRHRKGGCGIGFVLRDPDGELRRPVHAQEGLEISSLVGDGDAHFKLELGGLFRRRRDRLLRHFRIDAVLDDRHAFASLECLGVGHLRRCARRPRTR